MGFPFGETVTIVRPGAVVFPTMGDKPDTSTSTDVANCALWSTLSTELVNGQDTVTWELELVVPEGTDLLDTDQILFRGVTYEVVGRPMHWHSPLTGRRPGIQVQLRTATG